MNPVDRFCEAVEKATMADAEVFAPQALLDATVPNWRFEVRGGDNVREQLAHWFADPGYFQTLHRTPLAGA